MSFLSLLKDPRFTLALPPILELATVGEKAHRMLGYKFIYRNQKKLSTRLACGGGALRMKS
jgi:hypothetical protein